MALCDKMSEIFIFMLCLYVYIVISDIFSSVTSHTYMFNKGRPKCENKDYTHNIFVLFLVLLVN